MALTFDRFRFDEQDDVTAEPVAVSLNSVEVVHHVKANLVERPLTGSFNAEEAMRLRNRVERNL